MQKVTGLRTGSQAESTKILQKKPFLNSLKWNCKYLLVMRPELFQRSRKGVCILSVTVKI